MKKIIISLLCLTMLIGFFNSNIANASDKTRDIGIYFVLKSIAYKFDYLLEKMDTIVNLLERIEENTKE